ncbi:MAG TPA: trypsin-like peptidase domain-containing protein [Thermoanaerobaculia bacterium]|nr:trypsin-like peptidase domain-containing protein [Thermoanaerobaculia bacterium]
MSTTRHRNITTFLLVLGAVVFGMVLAGGLQLTVPSDAQPQPAATLSATQLAAEHGEIAALPSFADLAEAVDPAVVSIQAATIERGRRGRGVDPFEFFFGPRQRPDERNPNDPGQTPGAPGGPGGEEFRSDSGGSGFVISRDGLVVTNYHVIEGATRVTVHLGDRDYPAEVKGTDQATDLALLKINPGRDLRYLELGDSEGVRVGDWIMVVGNPLNLDKTVTTGVVSAKGRSIGINDISFENFIQTDAAINFGNSGGPILNMRGQVVGIATAINYGAENIGFAVPVNTLKEILPQLRDKGKVSRGYLGIEVANLDYTTAQSFGLETTEGALVQSVVNNQPADEAGIRHGDIIVSVDNVQVKTTRDLINYVSNKGPGVTVNVALLREGKRMERKVRLSERPDQNQGDEEEESEQGESGIDWLGIQYQGLTPSNRNSLGLPENARGVLVTQVEPTSPLYDQSVRPGGGIQFVITEVSGREVSSVADFESIVRGAKSGSFLRFYLQTYRRGEPLQAFFAVVQVP